MSKPDAVPLAKNTRVLENLFGFSKVHWNVRPFNTRIYGKSCGEPYENKGVKRYSCWEEDYGKHPKEFGSEPNM